MNIREFQSHLYGLINNSHIALDVIELILRDVTNTLHHQIDEYYAQAQQKAAEAEATAEPETAEEPPKERKKRPKGGKADGE